MSFLLKITGILSVLALTATTDLLVTDSTEIQNDITNINADWAYIEDLNFDVKDLQKDLGWKFVNLPHTWNDFDDIDAEPGYRRDASWYQKELKIEGSDQDRYLIYFEGSNITTNLFVNGKKAGSHIGGYVGFEIEITDLIILNKSNTISIKVDNGYNPAIIPSQKADFFIYGGITRDLWLKKLPQNFIQTTKVATPKVNKDNAETTISVSLNRKDLTGEFKVTASLFEANNTKAILSKTSKIEGNSNTTEIKLPTLKSPKLWSPTIPKLYTLKTELYQNGKLIHSKEEKIGFRWYSFERHGAFYLNGERLLLRGTHRHEEHAGVGAAMSNAQHRNDIEMIKGLGANFLRLGHYPQDPEVYKACDELGIIVWDELPWCRGGLGDDEWKKNTKNLLEEQIIQNYNHPSIFFWSLGNEIYWLPDYENGDDKEGLNNFVTELNTLSHKLDPNRMTAIRKYYDGSDLVDVFSPSIWSGWYAGVYTNYKETIEKNKALYPNFLHMEYGGSSHVGRHSENPITGKGSANEDDWAEVSNQVNISNIAKDGDWTENYIVDLFDWYLSITENDPTFTGNSQWAFKDFGTPLRPENAIPYMNQKGLVDREGNPKDAYYVFKSYWSDDPFAYIESHTWTERTGPQGKARSIDVYSNCKEVELYHNGNNLGKKSKDKKIFPAGGYSWDVHFTEGPNELSAKGYKNGKLITTDSMVVNYSYEKALVADHIDVIHTKDANGKHFIEAIMKDKNNHRVLDYEKRVYFAHNGAGHLVKGYGTPTKSDIIEMANGRAVIEYIPDEGKANFEVRNQDFKGSYLTLNFNKFNDITKADKSK